LWSVADEVGVEVVALAHTATDQAETMLLHLCRGAGLSGLSGMRPITPAVGRARGVVWRPLLHLDRAVARGVCVTLTLPFVDDPTNDDVAAPRTKIRHEVLPVLRTIRDGVDIAFARAAEAAAEADEALERWCDAQLRSRHVAPSGADGVTTTWSTDDWSTMPVAIRLRLIRRMCTAAGVPVDGLAARTIRSIDATLCRTGEAHAWDLHPGVRVEAHAGQLRLHAHGAAARGPNH
jgi:tRNA(Ile)-lysidine synthase